MSRKNIIFNDKKINKINFYKIKKLLKINGVYSNKILVSKKEPYGKKSSLKYFIGYDDNDDIRPLCIKLSQMIGYAKYVDSNKTMSFKVINKKLLKKYIRIWGKIGTLIGKEFDSEPVYGDNDKHIKTKTKSHGDKVNTNFQGKKIPKENTSYKCLSLIMLGSLIKVNKKYYPQTLLKECKFEIKKNKWKFLLMMI